MAAPILRSASTICVRACGDIQCIESISRTASNPSINFTLTCDLIVSEEPDSTQIQWSYLRLDRNIANAGSVIGLNQLGNDPVDWGDAYKFDAAAEGSWYSGDAHQAYFKQGNPALDNLGRIIDGKDGSSGVTPRG